MGPNPRGRCPYRTGDWTPRGTAVSRPRREASREASPAHPRPRPRPRPQDGEEWKLWSPLPKSITRSPRTPGRAERSRGTGEEPGGRAPAPTQSCARAGQRPWCQARKPGLRPTLCLAGRRGAPDQRHPKSQHEPPGGMWSVCLSVFPASAKHTDTRWPPASSRLRPAWLWPGRGRPRGPLSRRPAVSRLQAKLLDSVTSEPGNQPQTRGVLGSVL